MSQRWRRSSSCLQFEIVLARDSGVFDDTLHRSNLYRVVPRDDGPPSIRVFENNMVTLPFDREADFSQSLYDVSPALVSKAHLMVISRTSPFSFFALSRM